MSRPNEDDGLKLQTKCKSHSDSLGDLRIGIQVHHQHSVTQIKSRNKQTSKMQH